jgi:hypothetical protein
MPQPTPPESVRAACRVSWRPFCSQHTSALYRGPGSRPPSIPSAEWRTAFSCWSPFACSVSPACFGSGSDRSDADYSPVRDRGVRPALFEFGSARSLFVGSPASAGVRCGPDPRDASLLREMRHQPHPGWCGIHLQLRVHLLPIVCRANGTDVPQLRRRAGFSTAPSGSLML